MVLLSLLACTAPPDASVAAAPSPAARAVGLPVDAERVPRASAASGPTACGTPIYQPDDGWVDGDPVLADPHEDVSGTSPTPFHEHAQWPDDPSTTAAFVWRTDADTLTSVVEIEEEGTGDVREITGASFFLSGSSDDGRVHEVRVCGLTPDRTYTWRVGGDSAWSESHLHTTAPTPGSEPHIRFGVAGDSRDDMTTARAVFNGMLARGAQFVMFTGDAVGSGGDVEEWTEWFEAGEGVFDTIPMVPVNGNHEGLAQPFLALFSLPNNERNFSLDYGNLHLIGLNDTPTEPDEMETQAAWLRDDLAATTQTWRLVFHHKPGWTAASHPPDEDVRRWFVPVEEDGHVAVDFAGHNHNYERSVPLRDGVETTPEAGTTYVVTAGAGAGLYNNYGDQKEMIVGIVEHHYVIVDVWGPRLSVYAYDLAGNLLDSFTLWR